MGRKGRSKKVNVDVIGDPTANGTNQSPAAPLPQGTDLAYSLQISPVYGRYLVASREIKAGEICLSENFLVAGPMRSSSPVCLGCHGPLSETSRSRSPSDKSSVKCPKCGWPLCSNKCSASLFHAQECKFFQEQKIQAPKAGSTQSLDFGAFAVLRALLLKLNRLDLWKTLMSLEHHNEARKDTPLWQENQRSVVQQLHKTWNLGHLFTEEEIHTVCGILEVNSFELGLRDESSFRGIFPTAAMMAHNCVPNVTHFGVGGRGVLEIRAAVNIPAGSPLFFSYAYTLQGTAARQRSLASTKFFTCTCERCLDPTELETHLSTLVCPDCMTPSVLRQKEESVSAGKFWACIYQGCEHRLKESVVEELCSDFEVKVEGLGRIEEKEDFLKICLTRFHPTHYIPLAIKYSLAQQYGREVPLPDLSQSDLERKGFLCYEVLRVLDVITPGLTLTRGNRNPGLILHESQAAELCIARRIFEGQRHSKALMRRRLEKGLELLEGAVTILELTHHSSQEHEVGRMAKTDTLPALQRWVAALK